MLREHSMTMHKNSWRGLLALLFSSLACQPVIAVGWRELLVVFVLTAVLLGPPVYRFLRRLEGRSGRNGHDRPDTGR